MSTFNVINKDKEVVIIAELPGYSEKDIAVDCDGKTITVEGSSKKDREENDKGYFFSEQSSSSFKQSATLPAEVIPEKAKVSYKNNVLEIVLPKRLPEK